MFKENKMSSLKEGGRKRTSSSLCRVHPPACSCSDLLYLLVTAKQLSLSNPSRFRPCDPPAASFLPALLIFLSPFSLLDLCITKGAYHYFSHLGKKKKCLLVPISWFPLQQHRLKAFLQCVLVCCVLKT